MSQLIEQTEYMLDTYWDSYRTRVHELAELVFESKVKPFCKSRGWEFINQINEWAIEKDDGEILCCNTDVDDSDKELCDIVTILTLAVGDNGHDLGSLMPSWKLEGVED